MNDRVSDGYERQGVIVIYVYAYVYICIHMIYMYISWYLMLRIIRHNWWSAEVMYMNNRVSDGYERQGVIVVYIHIYTYVYT